MNGAHDLGGQMGFGPVAPEPERSEPVFHERWEATSLALNLAAGALGHWNIDRGRHVRESLPPARYLASSYYEIWALGLERLLLEAGLVQPDEIDARRAMRPAVPTNRPTLPASAARAVLAAASTYERGAERPASFAAGDAVRTINDHPQGHTRLPRYARGRSGTVEAVRGCMVFPDANAHGSGPAPEWCYTVVFDASELWGRSAEPGATVSIDAFEPYLVRR